MSQKRLVVVTVLLFVLVVCTLPRSAAAQPTVMFAKTWGGAYPDNGYAVATDRSGSVFEVGSTSSFGPLSPSCFALSILKYSSQGNLLWQKIWYNGTGGPSPSSVVVDATGNLYVAGRIFPGCSGGLIGFLLKIDTNGNLIWEKTMANVTLSGLALDSKGSLFLTGVSGHGIANGLDLFIVRLDANGNIVWEKSWGGQGEDFGTSIALDSLDSVYVAGTTYSSPWSSAGMPSMVLLKLDPSGNLLYEKIIGNGQTGGTSVAVDSTGNVYGLGNLAKPNGGNFLVLKFDNTGGPVWQRTWGGTRNDYPSGMALDPSGDLEVAGETNSFGAGGTGGTCGISACDNAVLLKLDGSANILSQLIYGIPNATVTLYGITDSYGTMVATGDTTASGTFQYSPGNNTLGTPTVNISSFGNNTLATPNNPITNLNTGTLQPVSGSQSYAGSTDQLLLRYGSEPQLTFAISPATGGTITLNGTNYSNGQNLTALGNATITANAPSGYTFTGWNTTGGVFVASSSSAQTQLTIAGNGTLTAEFKRTPSATLTYATYLILAALAALVALAGFIYYRRKKPQVSASQKST